MDTQEYEVSLGAKLAELRKQKGISLEEIASRIHIRKVVISDIEMGKSQNIPVVFMKGYIRAYAEIVGLAEEEYKPYLDLLTENQPERIMKNYSNKEQNRRYSKRLLFVSVILIAIIIAITIIFVWKDNQSNFVEVSHYISPLPNANIIDS